MLSGSNHLRGWLHVGSGATAIDFRPHVILGIGIELNGIVLLVSSSSRMAQLGLSHRPRTASKRQNEQQGQQDASIGLLYGHDYLPWDMLQTSTIVGRSSCAGKHDCPYHHLHAPRSGEKRSKQVGSIPFQRVSITLSNIRVSWCYHSTGKQYSPPCHASTFPGHETRTSQSRKSHPSRSANFRIKTAENREWTEKNRGSADPGSLP